MSIFSKKRSWYVMAASALLFAGFLYSISRFFLHAVSKEAAVKKSKQMKKDASWPVVTPDELFV